MYTSYSKVNDRFKFSTKGSFKCAYENTRTVITAGLITICVLLGLLALSGIYLFVQAQSLPGAASDVIIEMIYGQGSAAIGAFDEALGDSIGDGIGDELAKEAGNMSGSQQMIIFGLTLISIGFGMFLVFIAVIVFIIVCTTMRMGQTYRFEADEKVFTVIYPEKMKKTITIEYDYILGLDCEEWQYMLSPKCMDITIHTKAGDFTFRYIHTPMSKANGIVETPFNIIRERIGLADPDEYVLIDRQAAIEKKVKFM